MKKEILVIDIAYLTQEEKVSGDVNTVRKKYEKSFPNYDIIFIDSSKRNMNSGNTHFPPIYKL